MTVITILGAGGKMGNRVTQPLLDTKKYELRFVEKSETIHWPKTGKLTPRAWLSCDAGEMLLAPTQGLPQCITCPDGTFSLGETATGCVLCSPGTKPHSQCCQCSRCVIRA